MKKKSIAVLIVALITLLASFLFMSCKAQNLYVSAGASNQGTESAGIAFTSRKGLGAYLTNYNSLHKTTLPGCEGLIDVSGNGLTLGICKSIYDPDPDREIVIDLSRITLFTGLGKFKSVNTYYNDCKYSYSYATDYSYEIGFMAEVIRVHPWSINLDFAYNTYFGFNTMIGIEISLKK